MPFCLTILFSTAGIFQGGAIIVYGNYLVTDSTGTTDCIFLALSENLMNVFGDFTVQNVKFFGGNVNAVYLEYASSLVIQGNTLFTNIHFEGTSGIGGTLTSFICINDD